MKKIFAVNKDGLDSWAISVYPDGVAVALPPWSHGSGAKLRTFKSEALARASVEERLPSPPIWIDEASLLKVSAARDITRWEEPGDRPDEEIEARARELEGLGLAELAREMREIFISEALDLSGAELTGRDLTGAELIEADLSGANLTGAKLTGANLTRAELFDAKLSGANLAGADLTGANLTGANLTGANLSGADLSGALLAHTKITPEQLREAITDEETQLDHGLRMELLWVMGEELDQG